MKSSDLKVGNGYAYNSSRLSEASRPYYNFQCVVPLDNKVHHIYIKRTNVMDSQGNTISTKTEKVMERGRKALGYGTDYYNHAGKPYIEECGVPCMMAKNSGHVRDTTEWVFKLIDPRLIWDGEWQHWNDLAKEKADIAEAERQAREKARLVREAIILRMTTALTDERILSTMPVDDDGKRKLMYEKIGYGGNAGGILIASTDAMTWLSTLLEDYVELQEEVKDLRYELEG